MGAGNSGNTNKLLRAMGFSQPMSPEREKKAEDLYDRSNRMWNVISSNIKTKVHKLQKESLLEQQAQFHVSREDFFTPT